MPLQTISGQHFIESIRRHGHWRGLIFEATADGGLRLVGKALTCQRRHELEDDSHRSHQRPHGNSGHNEVSAERPAV